MKKFVITTNQNYIDVMKKILSDCQISGNVSPEIENYHESLDDGRKIYKCKVSGNKLTIEMPMPYRNSFASKMTLEILTAGEKTRINGSISSPLSGTGERRIVAGIALICLLGFLSVQTVRFYTESLSILDWIFVGIAAIAFLSFLPLLFQRQRNESDPVADDPYGVQMGHWISNLFPEDCQVTEK